MDPDTNQQVDGQTLNYRSGKKPPKSFDGEETGHSFVWALEEKAATMYIQLQQIVNQNEFSFSSLKTLL